MPCRKHPIPNRDGVPPCPGKVPEGSGNFSGSTPAADGLREVSPVQSRTLAVVRKYDLKALLTMTPRADAKEVNYPA